MAKLVKFCIDNNLLFVSTENEIELNETKPPSMEESKRLLITHGIKKGIIIYLSDEYAVYKCNDDSKFKLLLAKWNINQPYYTLMNNEKHYWFKLHNKSTKTKKLLTKLGFELQKVFESRTNDFCPNKIPLLKINQIKSEYKTYSEIKDEFETYNYKILNPVCFCVIDDDEILRLSREELITRYENLLYYEIENEQVKQKQFIYNWLKDPNNLTYKNIPL